MDVAVALDMPTMSLRLQLVMTDVVEDVLAVAVGNDSGSACNYSGSACSSHYR